MRSDADVLRMLAVSYDELIPGNNDLVISIHSYAYIHHTQTITSSIFERSQTRDGSVVQVRFDGKKFAGRVQYYATIQRNSLPECEVTIALCKFYANAVEIGSSAFGTMLFCLSQGLYLDLVTVVLLERKPNSVLIVTLLTCNKP